MWRQKLEISARTLSARSLSDLSITKWFLEYLSSFPGFEHFLQLYRSLCKTVTAGPSGLLSVELRKAQRACKFLCTLLMQYTLYSHSQTKPDVWLMSKYPGNPLPLLNYHVGDSRHKAWVGQHCHVCDWMSEYICFAQFTSGEFCCNLYTGELPQKYYQDFPMPDSVSVSLPIILHICEGCV